MIVLPNYFERYLAALRITVSLSVLKHGFKPRHLENLKKIYKAEALYHKTLYESVDINKLCNNLLHAANAINPKLKFSCKINGNFYINKKLFTIILLNASKNGDVTVFSYNNFLGIKFLGKCRSICTFVATLGGYMLYERNTAQALAVIPAKPTNEKSVFIESEWEYLFDKFSPVHLFYN